MKTRTSPMPQFAVWGICLIALGWIAATCIFEIHLGWPENAFQWAKRLLGWGVEIMLIRALLSGLARYHQRTATGK